jgi:ABC transport system ATP-binding/permease protein
VKLAHQLSNSPKASYSQLQEMNNQLEQLNKTLDITTERWLELAEFA